MRLAIRRADNMVMQDFQTPGPAPGELAASVAAQYGGAPADYQEVEVPEEMVQPIFALTHDPVWNGQALSLAPHVKTQAELDAEAEQQRLAALRQKLLTFDFSTITDLPGTRAALKDMRDFMIR